MRALSIAALLGVLLLVSAAAVAAAAPRPGSRAPMQPVVKAFTNSGVYELDCMGSYNRAIAPGVLPVRPKGLLDPAVNRGMLLGVVGAARPSWLTFCVTLHRP